MGKEECLEAISKFEEIQKKFLTLSNKYKNVRKNFDRDYSNAESKRIKEEIQKLNDEIINLKKQGKIKKEIDPLSLRFSQEKQALQMAKARKDSIPSIKFAEKIMTSEKVDPSYYRSKIENVISKSTITNSSDPKYPEKIYTRITERFTRLTKFATIYMQYMEEVLGKANELIDKYRGQKVNSFGIKNFQQYIIQEIDKNIFANMKKLEQTEIANSMKKYKILYQNLKALEDKSSDPQSKVTQIADKVGSTVTTGDYTIPNVVFDPGDYLMVTPFGKIKIKSTKDYNLIVTVDGSTQTWNYDLISSHLDSILVPDLSKQTRKTSDDCKKLTLNIIDSMIRYLKQSDKLFKLPVYNQDLLDKIENTGLINFNIGELKQEEQNAANALCGILMLSESHQRRNPTLGKFEKGALKSVKMLTSKNYNKPFGKVFSNRSGRYVPAHDITSYGATDITDALPGGIQQTSMLLSGNGILDDDGDISIRLLDLPRLFQDTNKFEEFFNKKITLKQKEELCATLKVKSPAEWANIKTKLEKSSDTDLKSFILNPKIKVIPKLSEYLQLYKFQKHINTKVKGGLVKIKDLPDDETVDIFDFGGNIKKTPKKYFEYLLEKNLKKIYKSQNRTLTSKMLKETKRQLGIE